MTYYKDSRHKLCSVTYHWENEKPIITFHKNFNDYDDLQKLDALADVLKELQMKYNEVLSRNKSLVIESLGHYIDEEEETKH